MARKKRGKVRIGLIGCGGIAQGHIRRTLEHPTGAIVALCEPNEAMVARTLHTAPSLANVPVYQDYRTMLKGEDLDAVQIHTPHTLHYEQVIRSLDAGLHVLCEKPMVCTVSQAKKVLAKIKASRRVFLLSYQRHYQGVFRYLRQTIQGGRIGAVQFISSYLAQQWMKNTQGTWRQDPKLSGGGQINDSGSHIVDILLWSTGLVVAQVSAFQECFDRQVDINSVLNIEFTNGALANISICGNAPRWNEDHTIVGSKGALQYRDGRLFQHDEETGAQWEVSGLRDRGNPDANFLDAITKGTPVEVPPELGLRVMELTEAAWKSAARGGRPVRMNPGKSKRKR